MITSPSPVSSLLTVSIEAMREPVRQGQTRSLSWRLEQLDRLEALLQAAAEPLLEALAQDLGKPPLEITFERVAVLQELKHARQHLRRWLKPRPVPANASWWLPWTSRRCATNARAAWGTTCWPTCGPRRIPSTARRAMCRARCRPRR